MQWPNLHGCCPASQELNERHNLKLNDEYISKAFREADWDFNRAIDYDEFLSTFAGGSVALAAVCRRAAGVCQSCLLGRKPVWCKGHWTCCVAGYQTGRTHCSRHLCTHAHHTKPAPTSAYTQRHRDAHIFGTSTCVHTNAHTCSLARRHAQASNWYGQTVKQLTLRQTF